MLSFFIIIIFIYSSYINKLDGMYLKLRTLLNSEIRTNSLINEIYKNKYKDNFMKVKAAFLNGGLNVPYSDKISNIEIILEQAASEHKKFQSYTLGSDYLAEDKDVYSVLNYLSQLSPHSSQIEDEIMMDSNICDFYDQLSKTIGEQIDHNLSGQRGEDLLNLQKILNQLTQPGECLIKSSENISSLFTHIDKHLFEMANTEDLDFARQENFDLFYSISLVSVLYMRNIFSFLRIFGSLTILDETNWFKDVLIIVSLLFIAFKVVLFLVLEFITFRGIVERIDSNKTILLVLPMNNIIHLNPNSHILKRILK